MFGKPFYKNFEKAVEKKFTSHKISAHQFLFLLVCSFHSLITVTSSFIFTLLSTLNSLHILSYRFSFSVSLLSCIRPTHVITQFFPPFTSTLLILSAAAYEAHWQPVLSRFTFCLLFLASSYIRVSAQAPISHALPNWSSDSFTLPVTHAKTFLNSIHTNMSLTLSTNLRTFGCPAGQLLADY